MGASRGGWTAFLTGVFALATTASPASAAEKEAPPPRSAEVEGAFETWLPGWEWHFLPSDEALGKAQARQDDSGRWTLTYRLGERAKLLGTGARPDEVVAVDSPAGIRVRPDLFLRPEEQRGVVAQTGSSDCSDRARVFSAAVRAVFLPEQECPDVLPGKAGRGASITMAGLPGRRVMATERKAESGCKDMGELAVKSQHVCLEASGGVYYLSFFATESVYDRLWGEARQVFDRFRPQKPRAGAPVPRRGLALRRSTGAGGSGGARGGGLGTRPADAEPVRKPPRQEAGEEEPEELSAFEKAKLDAFMRALKIERDPKKRAAAVKQLARLGRKAAAAVYLLIQALRDRAPAVRSAAAEALGRMGRAAAEAEDPLREAAAHDPDYQVRAAAAEALVGIGAEEDPVEDAGK